MISCIPVEKEKAGEMWREGDGGISGGKWLRRGLDEHEAEFVIEASPRLSSIPHNT